MSIFISVILAILAMVIQGFFQCAPASFLVFRHYTTDKNRPSWFIFGAEITIAILIIVAIWAMNEARMKSWFNETLFLEILAGILIVDGILAGMFYFKKDNGTRLNFIVNGGKNLREKYQIVKSNFQALKFGAESVEKELFFILPLILLFANEVCRLNFFGEEILAVLSTFGYLIAATIPLYFIKWQFGRGKNLAEIQRKREKNKALVRAVIGSGFLILAVLIITFRIING